MALAIFDLDNTLLADDSDYLWGEFLVTHNLVDTDWFQSENKRFYDEYEAGTLKIQDWLDFQLKPLIDNDLSQLLIWRQQFVEEIIKPLVLPKALDKIQEHRDKNDTLLILSATNYFITEPIATLFQIEHLLATKFELKNKQYTGRITGMITFQKGKITALENWAKDKQISLENSHFYSDSHNDIPLLEYVEHAYAVDPDDKLKTKAQLENWPIISFR